MKFRLKVMIAMMLLLSLAYVIGESLIITMSFRSTMQKEKNTAVQYYEMVNNTLRLATNMTQQQGNEDVKSTLEQLDTQGSPLWSGMRLYDESSSVVYYESGVMPYEFGGSDLLEKNSDESGGSFCVVRQRSVNDKVYFQITGRVEIGVSDFVLEVSHDVTQVYNIRNDQLKIYYVTLLAVVFLGAVVSYVVAALLTKPIQQLSKVSKEIAGGDLSSRAKIHSGDEIEQLSNDFNEMANKLEENIAHINDEMQRKEEFMGSFAHEMKTPMTSIIGYADLLRGQSLTPQEQQEAANYIFMESRRLESLSLKLLDLIVLKKRDFELRKASPAAVIRNVVKILKPVLAQKGVVIQCKCQDGSCMMEPDLVKSLIINLIDNARKALDGGGNIYILCSMSDDGCKIRVVDNGRGMRQEELGKITEAFYRVDKSRSRAQGGVGLGLALCNEIVLLHNGKMEFQSVLGTGTSVNIELRGGRG